MAPRPVIDLPSAHIDVCFDRGFDLNMTVSQYSRFGFFHNCRIGDGQHDRTFFLVESLYVFRKHPLIHSPVLTRVIISNCVESFSNHYANILVKAWMHFGIDEYRID